MYVYETHHRITKGIKSKPTFSKLFDSFVHSYNFPICILSSSSCCSVSLHSVSENSEPGYGISLLKKPIDFKLAITISDYVTIRAYQHL